MEVSFGSATVSSVLLRSAENAPVTGHYGRISSVMPAFWRIFARTLMRKKCQEPSLEPDACASNQRHQFGHFWSKNEAMLDAERGCSLGSLATREGDLFEGALRLDTFFVDQSEETLPEFGRI